MTLVVALRAADGVVLAADGQATSSGGVPTKTSTKKLDILHDRIAYGCAGPAGLRQRVRSKLQEEITPEVCEQPFDDLRDKLHAVVNEVQKWADGSSVLKSPLHRGEGVDVLFGGFTAGDPWIYEVTAGGIDQRHDLGEAIGAARHFAAYAIVSAEHYALPSRGLGQVRLLAYRAIDDAIRTDATELGHPVHVVQVTSEGAKRLDSDELSAVEGSVTVWQGHERDVFLKQNGELGPLAEDELTGTGIDPPSG